MMPSTTFPVTAYQAQRRSAKILAMKTTLGISLCFAVIATVSNSYPQSLSPAKNEDVAKFERRYNPSIQRFKEIRLNDIATDSQAEVYRLMIFPTWGNAISIRVQKHNGIYALSARRLDRQAGFQLGNLVEQKDFDLTQTDSAALEDLIQKVSLFGMPSSDTVRGADGDEWVIEGVLQGEYHFVERWCATSENPKKRGLANLNALCKFLVNKSKLSVRPTNKGRALI
jgi:hypothetical protein